MDKWSKKIKIVNLFFFLSILILLFQLLFSVLITPYSLNKSRNLIKDSAINSASLIVKINNFSDTLKNTTFFVEKVNNKGELENIFIRDNSTLFSNMVYGNIEGSFKGNTSIFAKTGFMKEKKLVLFNGLIQSQHDKNNIEYINFSRTELSLNNLASRTIKVPKIQEMSTFNLIECLINKDIRVRPDIPKKFFLLLN